MNRITKFFKELQRFLLDVKPIGSFLLGAGSAQLVIGNPKASAIMLMVAAYWFWICAVDRDPRHV